MTFSKWQMRRLARRNETRQWLKLLENGRKDNSSLCCLEMPQQITTFLASPGHLQCKGRNDGWTSNRCNFFPSSQRCFYQSLAYVEKAVRSPKRSFQASSRDLQHSWILYITTLSADAVATHLRILVEARFSGVNFYCTRGRGQLTASADSGHDTALFSK